MCQQLLWMKSSITQGVDDACPQLITAPNFRLIIEIMFQRIST